MDGSYSLEELIEMLDECLINATKVPFGKKDLVDVEKMTDIVDRIRRLIPAEISDAKRIVSDKNQILSRAAKEAESIKADAEKKRAELLEQTDILREARTRANEILTEAQNQANRIYTTANAFADSTFSYMEQILTRDLTDIHTLRQNLATSGNVAGAQPKAQQPAAAPAAKQPAAPTGNPATKTVVHPSQQAAAAAQQGFMKK